MTTSDFTTAAPIGSGRRKSQPLSSSKGEPSKKSKPNHNTVRVLKP